MKTVRQKLTDAIECLVMQSHDLPERIAHCYTHELADLPVERMPDDLKNDFLAVKEKLALEGAPHEGALRSHIRQLNPRECAVIARDILDLTLKLYARMGEDMSQNRSSLTEENVF